jgi:hypothetical protein
MSKFPIGEQVENAAGDHGLGTVAAGFPAVGGGFGQAVDVEGYGAGRCCTGEEPAFSLSVLEAA